MLNNRVTRRLFMGSVAGASIAAPLAALQNDAAAQTPVAGGWTPVDNVRPVLTPVAELQPAPEDEIHVTMAPNVPPAITRTNQCTFEVALESIEGVCPLDPENGVNTEMWGFRIAGDDQTLCGSPGPVIRGRVGDMVTIKMTNLASSMHPHNIDFHAVTGQGGGAEGLTANPGDTVSIQARLLYPGAFMYHCAYGDVPQHIAHGMYGMIIVDPEEPLPAVDHEWSISQSEWYVMEVGAEDQGVARFDRAGLVDEHPRYVTFNGRTDALRGDNALQMSVGERARIYFVNQGINLVSSFHPIGSHWDLVYPEAATSPANVPIRGSQSTLVVAGGGTVVELDALVPSTVILVDHSLVRSFYKGSIGQIVIEGEPDPEIFVSLTREVTEEGHMASPVPENIAAEVIMPEGAFLPENAQIAYSPPVVTIPVGGTVLWHNEDSVSHTVTSGLSDGFSGTPDGKFDSGFLDTGASFSHTFTEPGTYPYYCQPHPWMRGTLLVEE
ncbi:MAG: plastocyanin/azurin family copper-binding protein [Thermomicrobiales bacterium]